MRDQFRRGEHRRRQKGRKSDDRFKRSNDSQADTLESQYDRKQRRQRRQQLEQIVLEDSSESV